MMETSAANNRDLLDLTPSVCNVELQHRTDYAGTWIFLIIDRVPEVIKLYGVDQSAQALRVTDAIDRGNRHKQPIEDTHDEDLSGNT